MNVKVACPNSFFFLSLPSFIVFYKFVRLINYYFQYVSHTVMQIRMTA